MDELYLSQLGKILISLCGSDVCEVQKAPFKLIKAVRSGHTFYVSLCIN